MLRNGVRRARVMRWTRGMLNVWRHGTGFGRMEENVDSADAGVLGIGCSVKRGAVSRGQDHQ